MSISVKIDLSRDDKPYVATVWNSLKQDVEFYRFNSKNEVETAVATWLAGGVAPKDISIYSRVVYPVNATLTVEATLP